MCAIVSSLLGVCCSTKAWLNLSVGLALKLLVLAHKRLSFDIGLTHTHIPHTLS